MELVENISDVSNLVSKWKKQQLKVAFVPTMGNLHTGHLSLVEKALAVADKVVVSIYVNPMQFGAGEDFDSYPRTLDADIEALSCQGVDVLFLPTTKTMYPDESKATTEVYVPEITEILCGESRPGHFLGVSTIVNKFFNIIQPDIAIFGQKDFQQVAIIRRMVADLFIPIEILAMPTTRELDGLAKSSRNQYLTEDERNRAPSLYNLMKESSESVVNGADIAVIESKGMDLLSSLGFDPEYFSFRDPISLTQLERSQPEMVLVVAAKLGATRLIDNRLFSLRNVT